LPNGLTGLENRRGHPQTIVRGRSRGAADHRAMRSRVGIREVSGFHVTVVSNHPQRLWISLWTAFRRRRQVALPKGFSFFRSKIERRVFTLEDQ
jgi:hypothetical protein